MNPTLGPHGPKIAVLEKEESTHFGRLSVEIDAMAVIIKMIRKEGCKDTFSKICDTVKRLADNRMVLRKTRAQKEKADQAKMERLTSGGEARRLDKDEDENATSQLKEALEDLLYEMKVSNNRIMETLGTSRNKTMDATKAPVNFRGR